jgi:hypothetical protein
MTKQYNKMKVLRAMCIYSTTQGGLQKADYDNLRRVFIMNYGYQEMVTLMNLSDAGLFKIKDKKMPGYFDWNWQKIKESLKLVNDEGVNFMSPSDISYVYNGFAPISVRLIEMFLEHGGLAALQSKGILRQVGLTDDKIRISPGEAKFFDAKASAGRPVFKKKKILVYFIGGITFAEMAAIRFLSNLYPKYKFIIATTSIINGESALKQLLGPGTGPEDQGLLLGEILKK